MQAASVDLPWSLRQPFRLGLRLASGKQVLPCSARYQTFNARYQTYYARYQAYHSRYQTYKARCQT